MEHSFAKLASPKLTAEYIDFQQQIRPASGSDNFNLYQWPIPSATLSIKSIPTAKHEITNQLAFALTGSTCHTLHRKTSSRNINFPAVSQGVWRQAGNLFQVGSCWIRDAMSRLRACIMDCWPRTVMALTLISPSRQPGLSVIFLETMLSSTQSAMTKSTKPAQAIYRNQWHPAVSRWKRALLPALEGNTQAVPGCQFKIHIKLDWY